MPEYVVVDKEQLEADLIVIADAIREKFELTEKLEFPNGMKEVIDSFSLDKELTEQDSLIEQIRTALEGKAAGGNSKPEQEKSIEITENGIHEIVPDDGYALSKAVVNVIVKKKYGDLPDGYRRVDYIRFTGEQVVDTGVVCDQDAAIRVVFSRENSSQHYLYGVASSDNTASVTAYLGGSWRFGNKTATKTVNTDKDMIYSCFVDDSKIAITGNATAISGVNEFETVGSLLVGTCRSSSGGIGSAQFVGKILFFSIQKRNTDALRLLPVVSEDGDYRFWDSVGERFHDSITDISLEGGNL